MLSRIVGEIEGKEVYALLSLVLVDVELKLLVEFNVSDFYSSLSLKVKRTSIAVLSTCKLVNSEQELKDEKLNIV